MRIAFFGLPIAALLLARDGHTVAYAATCRAEAIGTRRLRRAIGSDRVEVRPDAASDATFARVREARPDLVVSWFWTTKIPMRVVGLAPLGGFGVHPSLLPRHRGPDPYFWAIEAGDEVTGVTAHRLAAEYDTGAILGVRALPIDPHWNAWTLAKKLDRPSLALLRATARAFAEAHEGQAPPPREEAQDEARATAAPDPDDDMLSIRWSSPSLAIQRRVRAAAPWPGAYTELGGETLAVLRVRVTQRFPRALAPGEAAVVDGAAVVRTGDGALELLEGRTDTETQLTAADLAALIAGGLES
jgi:methionyl-tRNA formyltransferase